MAITTINKSTADNRVAGDLKSLLDQHGIGYAEATCSHVASSQYTCIVDTLLNGPTTVQVTDDGTTIYEQGINAQ